MKMVTGDPTARHGSRKALGPMAAPNKRQKVITHRFMEGIWQGGKQIAFIKQGYAYDRQNKKRYKVANYELLDLDTGKLVTYLSPIGPPDADLGTMTMKKGLFD
jgi:hypothetical protein